MDTYNRYKMRASGERKHQAQSPPERIVFGIWDTLTKESLLLITLEESFIDYAMIDLMVIVERILADKETPTDRIVFAAMKFLFEKNMINICWNELSDIEKMDFLQKLAEHIQRCNY